MKAIILAGGFGTRLKSVVGDVPKSMAIIAGKPFLEHQIRFLKEYGITEIIIAVHHMADKIKSYFGNGLRWAVDITYSEEEVPLGTAGAIKNAERYIDDTFLVLNGDSYSNLNLNEFIEFHKSKRSNFSIALTNSNNASHYGSVAISNNKITEFSEKSEIGEKLVNAGVYIFEPKIFDCIELEKNVSLEKEIFPKLSSEDCLWGYIYKGYFIDIGKPETFYKFKEDVIRSMVLREHDKVREALKKISNNEINLVLIENEQKRLLGVITDRIIKKFMLSGGSLDDSLSLVMIRDPVTAKTTDNESKISELLMSGIHHLPIVDEENRVKDIEFRIEKIKTENFPILRGKAPLRISFAGGGTDLTHFYEKYGGVVINSTINKYCYATIIKRADSKIIINSDMDKDFIFDPREEIIYNGKFDLIRSIVKIMKPDFGFELYLHNDVPPGRGLGSSATLSSLLISLLSHLMETYLDDYKIAEIAYKAEREELKIKGGWQDQYAAVTGGFNFMEFNKDKSVIYPLKLKENVVEELNEHLILCYVGKSHFSGEQHNEQENKFKQAEDEIVRIQNEHKRIAIDIKDALLRNELENVGRLLHESWKNKRKLSNSISNPEIDNLYETGLKNGAYGGRLLGSGGGGYILFFFTPKKRNQLLKALTDEEGEIMEFNFEFGGTKIWPVKTKF